jgi:hypothetical protein
VSHDTPEMDVLGTATPLPEEAPLSLFGYATRDGGTVPLVRLDSLEPCIQHEVRGQGEGSTTMGGKPCLADEYYEGHADMGGAGGRDSA